MEIKPTSNFGRRKVEVRLDNEYEWQAVMDGLPRPGYWNMKDLPFVQSTTLQMIKVFTNEPAFPLKLDISERRLRKVGNKLLTSSPSTLTRDQMLGRLIVTTEIVHYFGSRR